MIRSVSAPYFHCISKIGGARFRMVGDNKNYFIKVATKCEQGSVIGRCVHLVACRKQCVTSETKCLLLFAPELKEQWMDEH